VRRKVYRDPRSVERGVGRGMVLSKMTNSACILLSKGVRHFLHESQSEKPKLLRKLVAIRIAEKRDLAGEPTVSVRSAGMPREAPISGRIARRGGGIEMLCVGHRSSSGLGMDVVGKLTCVDRASGLKASEKA
jgi:hypothetical protein